VIKRTRGLEPTYAYAISNAPVSTPFRTLVWLSGIRWAVEQCFEEGKTELGMAHYEVRKYAGWHHHMSRTMLAHFFLWHLKKCLGEKSASADGVTAPPVIRSRVAPACIYDCREPGLRGLGPTA
jgi:SRSO17 transposase